MQNEKIVNTLKHFKAILDCQEIILTGSFVLSLNGLVPEEKVGDLDLIIVNPSEACKKVILNLQESSPASTKSHKSSSINLIGITVLGGIKVDFFEYFTSGSERFPTKGAPFIWNGFRVASVSHIKGAKLSSGRAKDIIQLMNISNGIISEEEFKKKLLSLHAC